MIKLILLTVFMFISCNAYSEIELFDYTSVNFSSEDERVEATSVCDNGYYNNVAITQNVFTVTKKKYRFDLSAFFNDEYCGTEIDYRSYGINANFTIDW